MESEAVDSAARSPLDRLPLLPRNARTALRFRFFCHAVALSTALILPGCGGSAEEINVVVFNYWPRALADVYVDGRHVGAGYGAFGPGGTGGSVSCCFRISSGSLNVRWTLGGAEHDPLTGTMMSATASLEEVRPGASYLAIYLYPDGTAAADTAKGLPENRLPPAR